MTKIKKQIIAIGGGGLSTKAKDPTIEKYLLKLTRKRNPSVCFIPTASGEDPHYIVRFYRIFSKLPCSPSHLSLFEPPTADLESFILEKDLIYVGGGNTKSMLSLWKGWCVDNYLKKAWQSGIILAGSSAGAICWFEECVTDSIPGKLTVLPGLGFLLGSCCPHYDSEKNRRPSFHHFLQSGEISKGIALEDQVGAHFIDKKLYCLIKANETKKAYWVSKKEKVTEEEIIT